MWTLEEAIAQLTTTLAEDSTVFWTAEDRANYINQAQRRVATITKGVSLDVHYILEPGSPSITLSRTPIGEMAEGLYLVGGRNLMAVPLALVNKTDPQWRTRQGTPKWAVLDPTKLRVYFIPISDGNYVVRGSLAVLPKPLTELGGEKLFEGQAHMDRYQMAVIYLAATYAMFKERNQEDAPMFYNLFREEMVDAGVAPDDVPSIATLLQPGDSQ